MLADRGFQLGRNLGHRRHLDEVERIEQPDPQHAEEGVDPAHDRIARRDPILEILAVEAEHQDDRLYQAGAQYGVQISEKLVHGSSPCLSRRRVRPGARSEEHTSELQSLMRLSYAVFCLKTNKK